MDKIRIDGHRKVTKVTRIFTASKDGWRAKDFHAFCDNKGPTLCLIRSSENFLAGGFTSKPWTSANYVYVEDASAMVFALTNDLQVFKPGKPKKAVWHNIYSGPNFYGALALWSYPMNN